MKTGFIFSTPPPAGAAAIKYGSLFLDAPFHPDPAVALAMTVGPPIAVAAWLAVLKE